MIHFGFDVSEERHQKARAALDRALELDPEHPQVRLSLGEYHYFVHRDYDRALEAFELAEQDLPHEPELLVIKGFMLRRQNRGDEALKSLERAIQFNPRDPRVSGGLGGVYSMIRRYPEAMQYLDRTIALAPDEYTGYLNKARTYWAWIGDLKETRRVLEAIPAARQHYSAVVTAWFMQELYEGRYREALQRLSAANPDSASTLPGWKHLLAGAAYNFLDEPDQARQMYEVARSLLEKELEGHPEDHIRYPALRAELGMAYAGLGLKEEAIREGEAAVAHVPVTMDAVMGESLLMDLALIYTMVGNYDAAFDRIESLLAMPSRLSLALMQIDPRWAPLRNHPRFQDLTSKLS